MPAVVSQHPWKVTLVVNIMWHLCCAAVMNALEFKPEEEACTANNAKLNRLNETLQGTALAGVELAAHMELIASGMCDLSRLNWHFTGSVFYWWQIMTTIGFGTFCPGTNGGKAFTAVFAIPSIAIYGLLIIRTGRMMTAFMAKCQERVKSLGWFRRQSEGAPPTPPSESPSDGISLKALLFSTFAILALVATILCYLREVNYQNGTAETYWSWGESLYFVIITSTTIGLGDYYVDINGKGHLFWILYLVWLAVFGLLSTTIDRTESQGELSAAQIKESATRLSVRSIGQIKEARRYVHEHAHVHTHCETGTHTQTTSAMRDAAELAAEGLTEAKHSDPVRNQELDSCLSGSTDATA
jgi:hypothetical protein